MSDLLHKHFPELPTKRSYRVREIARYTGFSRWSIHEAINSGQLQAFRQGSRTLRISDTALREYLNSIVYDPFL